MIVPLLSMVAPASTVIEEPALISKVVFSGIIIDDPLLRVSVALLSITASG